MSITYTLDTRRLENILKQLPGRTEDVIDALAFKVEAEAKRIVIEKDIIDTGALLNSVYTRRGKRAVNYPSVVGSPEREELPEPTGPYVAYIGPSVEYALLQELGGSGRAGRPYMVPALRAVEGQITEMFKDWIDE